MSEIPNKYIGPIRVYLEKRLMELKTWQKKIKSSDPFSDEQRTKNNSTEEDLDEQVGHFDSEIKAGFVNKQIVGFRKALARIKIGKYGVCEKCKKMIDTDRLAVRPETTLCLDCEKNEE
ncbi:MAG: TraR/DksA C4-type zinc finger protein [Candidatus Shapirobacteria bacterium]